VNDARPTEPPDLLGDAAPNDRPKKVAAALVTLVVLVIVFAGILPQFGDYSAAWGQIASMSMVQLATLAAAVVASIVIYVFPFTTSLPGLRFGTGFMVRQSGFTISNAVPAGGALTLGVQYGMLGQAGFGGATSTAAIGITSVFNLLVTLALPVLGVVALLFVEPPTARQVIGAVAGLGILAVLVGLFATVLRSDSTAQRLGNLAERLAARVLGVFGKDAPDGIAEQLIAFRRSTIEVISARWAALTGSNFAQQFSQFLVLFVALRITEQGTTGEVAFFAAFAAFALARLASFIPVTPGGLGTVDAALTGLLIAFGATNTDALAATLLWRAASWVPQVLLGVATLVIWRIKYRGVSVSAGRRAASSG